MNSNYQGFTSARAALGGGDMAGYANTPPPATPIEAARRELSDGTALLHKIISELEQRLSPILGPTGPSGADGVNTPPPTALAAQIAMSAGSVRAAAERIAEIIRRLEL